MKDTLSDSILDIFVLVLCSPILLIHQCVRLFDYIGYKLFGFGKPY